MRKKEQFKRACTAIFASVFLLQTAIPVWASEKAEIALKAGNFSKETNLCGYPVYVGKRKGNYQWEAENLV